MNSKCCVQLCGFTSVPVPMTLEKAHIITYWATADTRIALVLNRDDADSKNDYYYVHAEPGESSGTGSSTLKSEPMYLSP